MRTRLYPAGLLALLLLGGCASMTESECQVADWGRVGLNDGARGDPESRLANYTKDCGKIGITPNPLAYRQGWDNGIKRFCTAAHGWQEGLAGHSGKDQVCMGQAGYASFSHYLYAGLQVYRTHEKMQENTQAIKRLQAKLEVAVSDEERRQIRHQLQDIDQEQYRLRSLLSQQSMMAP
jgi:hypothetical protein